VPAAAVIPALLMYDKAVAVKTLVVDVWADNARVSENSLFIDQQLRLAT